MVRIQLHTTDACRLAALIAYSCADWDDLGAGAVAPLHDLDDAKHQALYKFIVLARRLGQRVYL